MFKKLLNTFRKKATGQYQSNALMPAYARLPVCFARGEACTLFDTQGEQYLDALGGIAVTFLGHSHPAISQAISLQASKLMHTSNLFHIQEQAQLGEKFCAISGMQKVFFGNSGAEANEAAIKISRLYAARKKISRPVIICMHGSFHGRTMATLSASGNSGIQQGFEPLLSEFIHVAYNDLAAIEAHSNNDNVVAVLVEPIQGEAGVVVPHENYLRGIREICDANKWLMMVDEIQTGLGRTGEWFAFQHQAIQPDVVTSAKALGNGIPIGACAATGIAAEMIEPGKHGSTFGGNPLACQVAFTVLQTIEQDGLLEAAQQKGELLFTQLKHNLATHAKVLEIRGKGLMLGIQLDKPYEGLAQMFLDKKVVLNVTGGGQIIRLLPAALITDKQIKQLVSCIVEVLDSL